MAYYDEQLIREVESRVDIVDLVGETVALTRKGTRYWGLCPFHGEKTPSFCVSRERQMYYCFGCHKGGNVYSFLMETTGVDFLEAVQLLAERVGVKLPESQANHRSREKEDFLRLHQAAAGYYRRMLKSSSGEKARLYLQQRGVTDESIEKFGLGFASESWSGLCEALLQQGFSRALLEASGLGRISEKNGKLFDLLRNRIIFPIVQYDKTVLAFGGRGIEKEVQPKYLNSPETAIFSKRKQLYGLAWAKNAMREQSAVFLVEGYMDCVKLSQNGIQNVVASLGTAFTAEQAALLHRYVERVVLLYDGDEAGQQNTLRAAELLQSEGLQVETLTLPDAMDPDEFVSAYGVEEFYHFWQTHRHTVIEFKLQRWQQRGQTSREEQSRFLHSLQEDFQRLSGAMEREYHVELLSRRLGVAENVILRELEGIPAREIPMSSQREAKEPPVLHTEFSLVERVIAAMLERPEAFRKINENVSIQVFGQEQDRKILELFQQGRWANPRFSLKTLQVQLGDKPELLERLARLQMIIEMDKTANPVLVDDFIVRVKKLREQHEWKRLVAKIQQMELKGTNADGIQKLLFYVNQVFGADRKGETTK